MPVRIFIIEANSFSATSIAQVDYDMSDMAYEPNKCSAEIVRKAADEYTAKNSDKPR